MTTEQSDKSSAFQRNNPLFWVLLVAIAAVFWVLGSRRKPSTPAPDSNLPSAYDLNIDAQAEAFLARKHQLTYFLVTASVVPLGFTLNLLKDKNVDLEFSLQWGLLVTGGIAGLLAAGAALLSLSLEMSSHRRHVKLRYERKSLRDLSECEQKSWDSINDRAAFLRNAAWVLLVLEIFPLTAGIVDVITI